MPKTAVETAICDVCGAEVRDGSQFCYNCGGSVSDTGKLKPIPPPDEPIIRLDEKPANGTPPAAYDPAKRRAERSEKRQVRASNRQPVEIVWQPRTGFSWPFVITSLIFVFLAIGVIIAAFWVR